MGERERQITSETKSIQHSIEFCENTKNTHTPIHTPQQQREEKKSTNGNFSFPQPLCRFDWFSMETDTIYTNYSQNEILLVFGCQSEYRKLQEVINLCLSYKFDIVYEDGAVGGRTRGGEILFEFGLCNFRFDRKKKHIYRSCFVLLLYRTTSRADTNIWTRE